MERKGLKLRPHYLWIGGIFVAAGAVTAISWPRGEDSYALEGPENEWRSLTSIAYMQEMTAKICENSPTWPAEGSTRTLIDKRDGIAYTVAKIANQEGGGANCWMTKNLAFDIKANASKLTTALSDVTSDRSDWANSSDVVVENDKFPNDTDSSTGKVLARYTNSSPTTTVSGSGAYDSGSYGFYYNWCAATMGTCTNSIEDQPATRSATMSVCPAGWKLPVGGAGGQFDDLLGNSSNVAVDTVNYLGAPYNFLLSGYVNTDGFYNGGTSGYYWSSSSGSGTHAYNLGMNSSTAYPQGDYGRYAGGSVRCAADVENPVVYPEIPDPESDGTRANFSVVVGRALTLAEVSFSGADGTGTVISALPGQVATGKINVNVGSNVAYKINMSAENPNLTASTAGNNRVIPAVTAPASAADLKSSFGWGVMKKNSDNSTNDTVYTGLSREGDTFYTSETPAGASTITQFEVGVGVPSNIPADTYSTEVTVTAIATE